MNDQLTPGPAENHPDQLSLAHLRKDYRHASLSESALLADPVTLFSDWLMQALAAKIPEPNAMSVATVGTDGRPSSRILLIKDFDQNGFTWFTNYLSRKGQELETNPFAALLFHWVELERQVRIEGRTERVSDTESESYFNSRPLDSRLGAIASAQSQPIADRAQLEEHFRAAQNRYGSHPPRPNHWGGYRLRPERIEFWQGRSARLHDRILFTRQPDDSWLPQRLQP